MFLVVRGASHQSYGVWKPEQSISQCDMLRNTNTELSLSLSLSGGTSCRFPLSPHSFSDDWNKDKQNNIYSFHGVVPKWAHKYNIQVVC